MGWNSVCAPESIERRRLSPASEGQVNMIRGLYYDMGMDPYDIPENITSWSAHEVINELLKMKREM